MLGRGIRIYTDGSVLGKQQPGPGGWAAVVLRGKGSSTEISGPIRKTTNQRAELIAVISGLFSLNDAATVEVYTDSAYVVNAFNKGWISRWLHNGWKDNKGAQLKNRDLWETLLALTQRHNVIFIQVKGHSGNHYNERCDELAKEAAAESLLLPDEPEEYKEEVVESESMTILEAAKRVREA